MLPRGTGPPPPRKPSGPSRNETERLALLLHHREKVTAHLQELARDLATIDDKIGVSKHESTVRLLSKLLDQHTCVSWRPRYLGTRREHAVSPTAH